jgi:hypothetical protein
MLHTSRGCRLHARLFRQLRSTQENVLIFRHTAANWVLRRQVVRSRTFHGSSLFNILSFTRYCLKHGSNTYCPLHANNCLWLICIIKRLMVYFV